MANEQTIEIKGLPACPFCASAAQAFLARGIDTPYACCPNRDCPISRLVMPIEEWGRRPMPPGAVTGHCSDRHPVTGAVVFKPDTRVFAQLPGHFMLVPLTHGNGG